MMLSGELVALGERVDLVVVPSDSAQVAGLDRNAREDILEQGFTIAVGPPDRLEVSIVDALDQTATYADVLDARKGHLAMGSSADEIWSTYFKGIVQGVSEIHVFDRFLFGCLKDDGVNNDRYNSILWFFGNIDRALDDHGVLHLYTKSPERVSKGARRVFDLGDVSSVIHGFSRLSLPGRVKLHVSDSNQKSFHNRHIRFGNVGLWLLLDGVDAFHFERICHAKGSSKLKVDVSMKYCGPELSDGSFKARLAVEDDFVKGASNYEIGSSGVFELVPVASLSRRR
jgi:hypothetical protein